MRQSWTLRLHRPGIFRDVTGVCAAMTLRGDVGVEGTFGYNMSVTVGEDAEIVARRRRELVDHLGFRPERLALQKQVHGATVVEVQEGYRPGESDAMFTQEHGWLIGISIADCVPILFHDPVSGLVGGIHSGWRGTLANVVESFMNRVTERIGGRLDCSLCWVGPAAGPCCYEVGSEVAAQFEQHRRHQIGGGKYLLDNRGAVVDQLIRCGMPTSSIEVDMRCTICHTTLQSYRRDGRMSGRMLALIGRKQRVSARG